MLAERQRAERSDKGSVKLTPRDLTAFGWLAEMKAAFETDLGALLGRLNNRGPLGASAIRDMIDRWRRAGYARADRMLAGRPRIVTLTRQGAALAGIARWREPAIWTAIHTAEVAHLRLWLEGNKVHLGDGDWFGPTLPPQWVPETVLQQRARSVERDADKRPHVPDAVVELGRQQWAIELERTVKSFQVLRGIVQELTAGGPVTRYQRILYFVTTDEVGGYVTRAYTEVRDAAMRPQKMTGTPGYEPVPLHVLPYPEGVIEA